MFLMENKYAHGFFLSYLIAINFLLNFYFLFYVIAIKKYQS